APSASTAPSAGSRGSTRCGPIAAERRTAGASEGAARRRDFAPSLLRSFAPSLLRSFAPSLLRSFAPSLLRYFATSPLRHFAPSLLRYFAARSAGGAPAW